MGLGSALGLNYKPASRKFRKPHVSTPRGSLGLGLYLEEAAQGYRNSQLLPDMRLESSCPQWVGISSTQLGLEVTLTQT
jgi:hypothetical protein